MNQRILCFFVFLCWVTISFGQPNKKEISRLKQFLTVNIIEKISEVDYSNSQPNQFFIISINLNDSNKIKSVNILYNDSSNYINQYRKLKTAIQNFVFAEKMPANIILPVYLEFIVCCSKGELIDAGLVEYLKTFKKPYTNSRVYIFPLLVIETVHHGNIK